MACISARCPRAVYGPRASVRASMARPTVLARAAEEAPAAAPASAVTAVTDDTFKSTVLESTKPVLVNFWAPWCGPCKMLEPLIPKIAVDMSGELECVKLNTDESPVTASEYGVRSIPTIMVFKGGKRIETVIGAVPEASLKDTIKKCIA